MRPPGKRGMLSKLHSQILQIGHLKAWFKIAKRLLYKLSIANISDRGSGFGKIKTGVRDSGFGKIKTGVQEHAFWSK